MGRNTEPRLTAPEGIAEEQRSALALFLDTLHRHASETAAVLASYHSTAEIIADSRDPEKANPESLNGQILRVAGPLFETEADLDATPDGETVQAMRREITQAARSGAGAERRRILRMSTYAGEVATWAAEQELVSSAEQARPDGTLADAPGPSLAVQFTEPSGLPETA